MRVSYFTLSLAYATAHTPGILAWGAAGHEIVATIAQIHLHPSVFPSICTILNFTSTNPREPQCHLAPIAAWADRVRYNMRWSAPLHYIGALGDHPSQTCAFPGDRGWAGKKRANILSAVRNVTGLLEDWADGAAGVAITSEDDAANEALKFLVHFLGDLHMPLHLTGRDRGGNSNKVLFGGRHTNLHSLWDGLLIAKAIRTVPRNYSLPLPYHQIEYSLRGTIYDSYVRRIMWEGILGKWADEIPSWLSCPVDSSPSSQPSSARNLWQHVLFTWGRWTRGVAEETDDDILCPYHWAKPIHALNCEIVWPRALDEPPYSDAALLDSTCHSSTASCCEPDFPTANQSSSGGPYLQLDTPEYAGVISERMIIEKLLAQAGIRLAAVINWLFADLEEVGGELRRGGLRAVA